MWNVVTGCVTLLWMPCVHHRQPERNVCVNEDNDHGKFDPFLFCPWSFLIILIGACNCRLRLEVRDWNISCRRPALVLNRRSSRDGCRDCRVIYLPSRWCVAARHGPLRIACTKSPNFSPCCWTVSTLELDNKQFVHSFYFTLTFIRGSKTFIEYGAIKNFKG